MKQLFRHLIFASTGAVLFLGFAYVNLFVAPQLYGSQLYLPTGIGVIVGIFAGIYFNIQARSREVLEQQVKLRTQELRIANEKLKHEVEIKNRFFSIIAHDLKSPFTSLLGMTYLMSQKADNFSKDKLVELAAGVNEAGEQVFGLLQNLLEWARFQIGGGTFEPQIISLPDLARESIDVLTPVATDKDITLTNEIKNATAYADRDMIQTVIRNLVANSLKFTPRGGSVEVSSDEQRDLVQVTVTDSGVGIPEEQISKIFAIDQKTSTRGTDGEVGTGLGLPLCKEMLEKNGGNIWVESQLGEGSRFHFVLPTSNEKI